jgi:uncharacterized protein YjiS (DUF1127 family)
MAVLTSAAVPASRHATRRPAASRQLSLISPFELLRELWARRRTRRELEALSPALRADIGLPDVPPPESAAVLEVRLATELLRH